MMNNDELLDNLKLRVETLRAQGRAIIEDENLRKNVDEVKEKASELVKNYPLATLAGGFFVGMMFGVMLSGDD